MLSPVGAKTPLAPAGTGGSGSVLKNEPDAAGGLGRNTGSRLARIGRRSSASDLTWTVPSVILSPVSPAAPANTSPTIAFWCTGSSRAEGVKISTRVSAGKRKVSRPRRSESPVVPLVSLNWTVLNGWTPTRLPSLRSRTALPPAVRSSAPFRTGSERPVTASQVLPPSMESLAARTPRAVPRGGELLHPGKGATRDKTTNPIRARFESRPQRFIGAPPPGDRNLRARRRTKYKAGEKVLAARRGFL